MSTGVIETGLITRGSVAYTAWGDPVRAAMMIGSLSTETLVGVDESTVEAAGSAWRFQEAEGLIGIDGREHAVSDLVIDEHPSDGPAVRATD